MAGGKFSKPRPHRDEERQIEEAFRQVTGQAPKHEPTITPQTIPQDTVFIPVIPQEKPIPEQPRVEEPLLQSAPQQAPVISPEPAFDLPPEDLGVFFQEPLPEEPEETQPDFLDKLLAFVNQLTAPGSKQQTALLLGICGLSLLVIVICIALFFAGAADPNEGKILENVYIANINVGGMTKSEAISAVKEATSRTYGSQDMVIDLSGTELRLSPKDTGAKLDAKAAVNAAYDYGRSGTKEEKEQILALSQNQPYYIGILPYLDLDEDFILDTLTAYAQDSGSTLTQPTYGLEGQEPALSADKFNEHAPTQTLIIHMGTPGIGFDVNDVYEQVLDAYSLHIFLVTVENVESVKEPDAVDLQKIYEEFYIAPVDASVNLQTFAAIPGSYGYGFDLEAAQKLLAEANYGDVLRIPMIYIAPDVLDGDSFYRDTLGVHQTRHTSNENRNTNLRLACEALDGTVIEPGATFSFNQTVGQRTSDKGYKSAPADSSATGETTLGGGINQVSSTLYYAALLSELDVTSRRPNAFAPNYIDFGFDAAVSWDLYDFSFRNNYSYPIMIDAEVSGGYVRIKILGTEERSHYVMLEYDITKTTDPKIEQKEFEHKNVEGYKDGDVIQEGVTGYTVKTYKIKYDSATSNKLTKDYIATTEYKSSDKIIAKVLPEETTAPTTEPTTAPTETEATTIPTTVPSTTEATVPEETQASTEATTLPTESVTVEEVETPPDPEAGPVSEEPSAEA